MTKMNFNPEWKNKNYYFFPDDIEKYPDAWCIIVWSRRGPGKTYSALRFAYENKIPIVYAKRTIDDVNIICSDKNGIDLSPYVPINRDCNTNIKTIQIEKGIGGVYDVIYDEDDKPLMGKPISYIAALNAMKVIKGFDLSHCEWLLLDEFIPQSGEIVRRSEGEMLLDLYMTIQRDRVKRGRNNLKLILFANSENISTPITNELDIVDSMCELMAQNKTHLYLDDRGILLHHITNDEIPIQETEKTGIYKAMANTSWGRKAFYGDFANNDFSSVKKINLNKYTPVVAYTWKNKNVYVYRRNEMLYFSKSKNEKCEMYDLNLENDQKRFYYDYIIDFRNETIEHRVKYESYTMYDLVVNYKGFFKI